MLEFERPFNTDYGAVFLYNSQSPKLSMKIHVIGEEKQFCVDA